MLKYTNSFIEVSALGDFETEIQKLYNKLRRDATITSTRFEATPITEQDSTKDYLFSDILADVGRGKISTGLKSLELLSIIRTGTQPSNLFLFDNKIVYGTAASFNTAVSTDLVDIILKNIGMYDIINNIEGEIYHVYFSLAYGITPSLFVSSTVSGDSFLTRVRLEEAET